MHQKGVLILFLVAGFGCIAWYAGADATTILEIVVGVIIVMGLILAEELLVGPYCEHRFGYQPFNIVLSLITLAGLGQLLASWASKPIGADYKHMLHDAVQLTASGSEGLSVALMVSSVATLVLAYLHLVRKTTIAVASAAFPYLAFSLASMLLAPDLFMRSISMKGEVKSRSSVKG